MTNFIFCNVILTGASKVVQCNKSCIIISMPCSQIGSRNIVPTEALPCHYAERNEGRDCRNVVIICYIYIYTEMPRKPGRPG